jgi:succinate dehydrogenase / fumarate reductase flavoprotein subunit
VHGRNRLIGNSTLDIFVFGRRAGRAAANWSKEVKLGSLTLEHVRCWQKELEQAGLSKLRPVSPLLLPDYARPIPDYLPDYSAQALTAHRIKLT